MTLEPLLTYRGTVYPWHCDHVGHMNVMWYVGKFDEATWQFFNALGLTPRYLRSARRGMAAVDQHISYLRELHAGDVVSVRTRLIGFKEKSVQFVHEMSEDEQGEVVAQNDAEGGASRRRTAQVLRVLRGDRGENGRAATRRSAAVRRGRRRAFRVLFR